MANSLNLDFILLLRSTFYTFVSPQNFSYLVIKRNIPPKQFHATAPFPDLIRNTSLSHKNLNWK